jgi:hypothetical protein
MKRTLCLALALALAMGMPASAQYLPRGSARSPRQATAQPTNGLPDAIATVNGTFKSADKKFVTVQVENDQLMRMFITGSTKFIRDGKPAKASEFELGETVVVDTTRDQRMNLLAVRIELVKPDGKPKPEPTER